MLLFHTDRNLSELMHCVNSALSSLIVEMRMLYIDKHIIKGKYNHKRVSMIASVAPKEILWQIRHLDKKNLKEIFEAVDGMEYRDLEELLSASQTPLPTSEFHDVTDAWTFIHNFCYDFIHKDFTREARQWVNIININPV